MIGVVNAFHKHLKVIYSVGKGCPYKSFDVITVGYTLCLPCYWDNSLQEWKLLHCQAHLLHAFCHLVLQI